MGFSTIRWGGALCFLGAGFGLMLIQMESPSIVKPIAEDVLILMGVAFACRALLQRFGRKPHTHLEFAIIASTGVLAALSLLLRSEEHTSELQSLMRISYAVFCLKQKTITQTHHK